MKKFFKILLIIFLFMVSIIIYARFIGTMGLVTKEYTVVNEGIPEYFDGLKIVHLSDLHYNRAINIKKVNSIVERVNLINPDIVVFTGDLIDKDVMLNDDDYNQLIDALKSINVKYGKYAVLGNHDIAYDIDKVIKIYKDSDFIYLDNSSDIIYSPSNESIFIGGLNSVTYNNHDINKLTSIDNFDDSDYKIVIVHEPDIADELVKKKIDLVLAGHSHNGQIKFPGIGAIYTPEHAKKYYDEYYKIDSTDLFVSSGIGVSTFNYRLFNHPSINLYRINKS